MEYVKIKVDESKAEEIRDFYDVPVNQNPKNEYEYFKAVTPDNVEVTCYRSKKLFTIVFAGDKEAVLDEASIFADNVMLTEKRSNDVGPDYWEDIHTQIGSDEVGIGDFFGGFYVAAVYLSGNDIGLIDKLGIADSKKLTDSKMLEVAPILRQNIKCHVVSASAKKVNELVDKGWSTHKIMANLHNLAHIKLIEKYNVVMAVTQPDKEIGRKKEIKFSPVKECAIKNNIKVFQPSKIRENYKEILDEKPDIIITCAYGQIIPKELLDYPKYGCINIHASLLPKLRGGAPIHKAIINGYEKTGVTIMYMDEKMDSGDIIYQEEIKIEDDDNAGTLFDKLSVLGSEMIIKVLPSIIDGTNKRIKQNEEEVTYAYNITREEEKVDFNLSTKDVYNKIRGLYPWPIGYTSLDGKKVKLHLSRVGTSKKEGSIGEIINIYNDALGVKTLDGEILLTMIQFEGKKKILVKDYLNGVHDKESLLGKKFI